jgi:putative peptidoglycan lipid II flippase
MVPLDTVGLALASNVAVVVQAAYLQVCLGRKRDGFEFHHVTTDLMKVVAAAALMGGMVAAGWWAWTRLVSGSKLHDALGLCILIGAGVAAYAGMLWGFKIEGRNDLASVIYKLRRKPA